MSAAPDTLTLALDVPARAQSPGSVGDAFAKDALLAFAGAALERQAKTLIGLRAEMRPLLELKGAAVEWAKCEEWIDANPDRATDPTIKREQRERRATLLIVLWDVQRQNNQTVRTEEAK